jgi:hypothetical protein
MADSIFIDEMSTNYNEEVVFSEMNKKYFYECLDFYDYKVENVMEEKVFSEHKEEFNYILRKVKEIFDINIYNAIMYLEKDFLSMFKILKILDDANKYTLKLELGEKYNIKVETSFLKYFFCE